MRVRLTMLVAAVITPAVAFAQCGLGDVPRACRPALSPPPLISPPPSTTLSRRRALSRRSPPPLLAASSPSPPRGVATAVSPRVTLGVLLLLYVSNQWSRSLPSFLVSFAQPAGSAREFINVALGFDQAQYGLLVSYGFSLLYTACSFPAGYAADRFPRKPLLLASAVGWAIATAAQAASTSFTQLLCARVMLGVAQSFCGPAAHTIISELFPNGRATANAVYSSGIYFGAALASLSVLLNKSLGWRATSLVVAAASAIPTLILAFVLPSSTSISTSTATSTAADPNGASTEVQRGSTEEPAVAPAETPAGDETGSSGAGAGGAIPTLPPPIATLSTTSARTPPPSKLALVLRSATVRYVLAAAGARLFAGFAIGAWTAPFYRQYFASHTNSFGVVYAIIVACAGTFSTIAGGALSDRLVRGGQPHRAARVPLVGSLVAVPFWLGAMNAPTFGVSILSLLLAFVSAECWFGSSVSLMQGALPSQVWGTAQGMLNVVQIAGNISPILIGALIQRGFPLRRVLGAAVPAAYVVCAGFFYLAGEARLEHDQAEATRQAQDAPKRA